MEVCNVEDFNEVEEDCFQLTAGDIKCLVAEEWLNDKVASYL